MRRRSGARRNGGQKRRNGRTRRQNTQRKESTQRGGDDGWQAQGGPADAKADSWGAGRWVEDGWGSW
eukprot:1997369-Prymnesium_polylepis.1